jgi:phage gp46-like protein
MSPDAIRLQLKDLNERPDDAIIADPVAAELLGISLRTLRRHQQIQRVQLSPGRVGRRAVQ